jgi:hypothetical protein
VDFLAIIGAVIIIVITLVLGSFLGDAGLLIVGAIAFGMLFSVYMKVRILIEDNELIKEKLGILNTKELEEVQNLNMNNEDIERELEEYQKIKSKND